MNDNEFVVVHDKALSIAFRSGRSWTAQLITALNAGMWHHPFALPSPLHAWNDARNAISWGIGCGWIRPVQYE
jgi:hypothetical protein